MKKYEYRYAFYSNKRASDGLFPRVSSAVTEDGFKKVCARLGIPAKEANAVWNALQPCGLCDGYAMFSTDHSVSKEESLI